MDDGVFIILGFCFGFYLGIDIGIFVCDGPSTVTILACFGAFVGTLLGIKLDNEFVIRR